jgi:hypothetical protein
MGVKQSCHTYECENRARWKIYFDHETLKAFNAAVKNGGLDKSLKALETLFNNTEKLKPLLGKIVVPIGEEGGEVFTYACQQCYESIDFEKLPCGWSRDQQRHLGAGCFGLGMQHF